MTSKKTNQANKLSSFYSAYDVLLRTAKTTVNYINEKPSNLVKFCNTLKDVKEKKRRIHIVGMGRSGKVGMLIGEILKNIGYSVSYLGKSLARPVRPGDAVIGVTGSGWTNFTIKAIQDSIRKKAHILVFTGDKHSIAARLADSILPMPRGYVRETPLATETADSIILIPKGHVKEKSMMATHAPLTPMGTVFEMTTMAVGIGVVLGLNDDSSVKGFNEGVNEVLKAAEITLDNIKKNEEHIQQFVNTLESYSYRPEKKVWIFGSGLDSIIASISSIRLSHLKINVKSAYDWRFRRKNDLFVAISGSGVSTSTLERVESAKSSDMKIIGLTSFPNSKLTKCSDFFLGIEGRSEKISADLRQISDLSFSVPSFEYVAAITLDACVAQLAMDLDISEKEMKAEHANIE
ncbi:MAG: SIS domain-containing protein [Candidatus Hodarchaeales archaeon]